MIASATISKAPSRTKRPLPLHIAIGSIFWILMHPFLENFSQTLLKLNAGEYPALLEIVKYLQILSQYPFPVWIAVVIVASLICWLIMLPFYELRDFCAVRQGDQP